jgi:hypothetical protein
MARQNVWLDVLLTPTLYKGERSASSSGRSTPGRQARGVSESKSAGCEDVESNLRVEITGNRLFAYPTLSSVIILTLLSQCIDVRIIIK